MRSGMRLRDRSGLIPIDAGNRAAAAWDMSTTTAT